MNFDSVRNGRLIGAGFRPFFFFVICTGLPRAAAWIDPLSLRFKGSLMKESWRKNTSSHLGRYPEHGEKRPYPSGESVILKRVRTCSDISSMAPRLDTGSDCVRYLIASTSRRWPST